MKKLMIAAAIVCAAAVSQAAVAKWSTGVAYKPVDAKGTKGTGTTNLAKGANLYLFDISATDYAKYAAMSYADASAAIWKDYGTGNAVDDVALGKATDAHTAMANGTVNYQETVGDNAGKLYRAVLITYKDANLGDFYIANVGTVDVGGTATYGGTGNLATTFSPTSGAIGSWTAVAVPEPTSGLLLLLGVAGLALKRRRA